MADYKKEGQSKPAHISLTEIIPLIFLLTSFLTWLFFYSMLMPFKILSIDSSVYIAGAKQILSGGVPYLDFWDHKPPMVFFLYALVLKTAGISNYIAVNLVTFGFAIISTSLIYLLSKKIFNGFTAGCISLLYPFACYMVIFHASVIPNTEIYMEPFILAGILCGFSAIYGNKNKLFFLSGVLFGLASSFKQPAVLDLAAFWLFCLFYISRSGLNRAVFRGLFTVSVLLFSGFCLIWFVFIIYFALNGALYEFWFQAFKFNFYYSSVIEKKDIITRLFILARDYIKTYPVFFTAYLFGFFTVAKDSVFNARKHPLVLFLFLWNASAIISVSSNGLFFGHYFFQWIPPAVITVFYPAFIFQSAFKNRLKPVLACYVFFTALFMLCLTEKETHSFTAVSPIKYRQTLKAFVEKNGSKSYNYPINYELNSYNRVMEAVTAIKTFAPNDSSLFVWGIRPELYLLINRKPASRFLYTGFISGNFILLGNLYGSKKSAELKKYHKWASLKLMSDLEKSNPKVIVVEDTQILPQSKIFFDYLYKYYKNIPFQGLPFQVYLRKGSFP